MITRAGLTAAATVVLAFCAHIAAAGAAVYLCVPYQANKAVKSGGTSGTCKEAFQKIALPASESEQQTLLDILPYVHFNSAGIDEKPTISFSGVNVQIANGTTVEASANGVGNLVIGYDEGATTATGSHDLILGSGQSYSSWGDVVAGTDNNVSAAWSASFGEHNIIESESSGSFATGTYGTVDALSSAIFGGCADTVGSGSGQSAGEGHCSGTQGMVAAGGERNRAFGPFAAVTGGRGNDAYGEAASVTGGEGNTTDAAAASVTGGGNNKAETQGTAISGGESNTASGGFAWIGGGISNRAIGNTSVLVGGSDNQTTGFASALDGGEANDASGERSWLGGGYGQTESESYGVHP